jgi:hypothetical protein
MKLHAFILLLLWLLRFLRWRERRSLSSGTLTPDDGGSDHFRNVGQFLRDYTAQYPTTQSSSGGRIGASRVLVTERRK